LYLFPARTLDTILFFSNRGKVYAEKAYQIPDSNRSARGIPIVNLLSLAPDERITAALAVGQIVAASERYCFLATRQGRVKRLELAEFASLRPSGVIAIVLEAGDELGWARLTNGNNEIILVTEKGQALRFAEAEVRSTGRMAGGVNGIRLEKGDYVTSMEVIEEGGYLLTVTARGFGKRTPLEEYPLKGRAGGGVVTFAQKALAASGPITAARVVQKGDDVTIISRNGFVLRNRVIEIRQAGRATRGDRLMDVAEGDAVASLGRLKGEANLPDLG
jgi:DNA gyrase subunit A